jgi:TPR repeat protein
LAGLPASARFCPKCGKSLIAVVALPVMESRTLPELPLPAKPLEEGDERALPSLVLLGFSNAIFRLGWRYEHGQGVWRNANEADRCYSKSARLGNPHAQSRLAENEEKKDIAADKRG